MKSLTTALLGFLCCLALCKNSYAAGASDNFLFGRNEALNILINNRVLARVNGKPITVMDVMKKMDMLFLRQFPEYTSIPQARMQYYEVNWKHVLEDLIDKELILADAEENKITVTSGDVRQEMETLFGPNIIENLDKIGLSFDEAYKIVQGDLVIRRVMFTRVHGKALHGLTPQVITQAYEEFAKNNMRKDTWQYKVVSIRNINADEGKEMANFAHRLLLNESCPLDKISEKLKESFPQSKGSISVSDDFFQNESELSEVVKPALIGLHPGSYSEPIAQKSRVDKSTVFRIVFLKDKKLGGTIPFSEVEMQLKETLLGEAIENETTAYLDKLRQYFDLKQNSLSDLIPEDFEPFALK